MSIYVGNLSYSAKEEDLEQAFLLNTVRSSASPYPPTVKPVVLVVLPL